MVYLLNKANMHLQHWSPRNFLEREILRKKQPAEQKGWRTLGIINIWDPKNMLRALGSWGTTMWKEGGGVCGDRRSKGEADQAAE